MSVRLTGAVVATKPNIVSAKFDGKGTLMDPIEHGTEPNFVDLEAATERIANVALVTPLLRSPQLDADTGRRIFIKAESLQIAGSFKFRGAFNRLSQMDAGQRKAGVVAWSSGNHAQGVAAAGRALGIHVQIVMPADAPPNKLENTRRLGAAIVTYDRKTESREDIAFAIARRTGAIVVPSFDDPHVIAGQGTCGIEIAHQMPVEAKPLDALLVCCGGGGLIAGCAIAMETLSPSTKIHSVEPEHYDDHARSLVSGERERADVTRPSLCDALLAPSPGRLTWPINRRLLSTGLVVSDTEVRHAMRYAWHVLKLVVEPGGAVALAALLAGKVDSSYRQVGIVLSGGNVEPALFAEILSESQPGQ